jgi:hypothetical protein
MACSSHDCSCFDRLVKELELFEADRLEMALKLSKIPNRNRDIFRLSAERNAISHILKVAHTLACEKTPPPRAVLPWWRAIPRKIFG